MSEESRNPESCSTTVMAGCLTPSICVGRQRRVREWNIRITLLETQLMLTVEQSLASRGGHACPLWDARAEQAGLVHPHQCWAAWAAGRGCVSPCWSAWCSVSAVGCLGFNSPAFTCGSASTWSDANATVHAWACSDVRYRESCPLQREIKCCRGGVWTQTWLF